jgi:molecular chaperone GrpE
VSEDKRNPETDAGAFRASDASDPEASNGNGQAAGSAETAPAEEGKDALTLAQEEVAKIREQLLRTAADFDNYRKRSRREAQDLERRAREDMLRDLLPVFDDLERAAQHAGSAKDVQSLAEGISIVMRQFTDTLGKLGIERLESVGQAFDPSLHEAIQQLETDQHPPGSVAAEVRAGYRFGDRLIRPAMVVVAKPPSKS